MFDPGFTELLLLFVIALLILGPERLPRVAGQLGRWVGRARRTANQLRHQLEREIALDDMAKAEARGTRKSAKDRGTESASTEPGSAADDANGPAGFAAAAGAAGTHEATTGTAVDGDAAPASDAAGDDPTDRPASGQ